MCPKCLIKATKSLILVKKENGDFLDDANWQNWKVLRGRNGPEEPISTAQQYRVAKAVLTSLGIHSSRVTHGGRHAGAMEAEALGIPLDIIKKGGGWKDRLGRLETHYLGKLPSQFAKGMAGFWEKSFRLPRNNVSPSLSLQRTIFPWIENYFGSDNDSWKKFCEQEMKERDDNIDDSMSDDDAGEGGVEFVAEDGAQQQRQQRRRRMSPRPLYQSGDTSKRGFLRLLLRCRRIILQDAAVFFYENRKNNMFVDSTCVPFNSPGFKEFQKEVVASLSDPDNNILQQYEGLVPSIVDSQVEVATRLGEISNRVAIGQEKAENSFAQQQQVNSRMESMLLGVNQQLQQVCRNQQMLIVNQHYLGYQVQSLMMANMPVNDSNFVPPAPSSSSSSTFVPLPPPHVPLPLPPIPHSTPPPLPPSPPPHPSSTDPNRNSSRPSTKSKGKKRARWISYDPEA